VPEKPAAGYPDRIPPAEDGPRGLEIAAPCRLAKLLRNNNSRIRELPMCAIKYINMDVYSEAVNAQVTSIVKSL